MRIGQSTDIHQLAEGRKLVLGGVEIPHTKGLVGHSDADALTHAVAEAILGSLAETYFISVSGLISVYFGSNAYVKRHNRTDDD